jgi:hypothetical protein
VFIFGDSYRGFEEGRIVAEGKGTIHGIFESDGWK